MKLHVQSIHFTADAKLLDFLQKKLDKLETFNDTIIDGEVFLKLDKNESKGYKVVNIKLNIPGNEIVVKEQRDSFEEAIDHAYDTLKNQLTKHKEKSVSHYNKRPFQILEGSFILIFFLALTFYLAMVVSSTNYP